MVILLLSSSYDGRNITGVKWTMDFGRESQQLHEMFHTRVADKASAMRQRETSVFDNDGTPRIEWRFPHWPARTHSHILLQTNTVTSNQIPKGASDGWRRTTWIGLTLAHSSQCALRDVVVNENHSVELCYFSLHCSSRWWRLQTEHWAMAGEVWCILGQPTMISIGTKTTGRQIGFAVSGILAVLKMFVSIKAFTWSCLLPI